MTAPLTHGQLINYQRKRVIDSLILNSPDFLQRVHLLLRSTDARQQLPAAADIALEIRQDKGVPLAIWLGNTIGGVL